MRGFEQDLWIRRGSEAGQWAAGALRSVGAIALSALFVWIAVSVINDSGLLKRPTPAPHSPAGGSSSAESAFG